MFGYIKPFKPELKFKEFDIYKSVYCGFCKLLGKSYGSVYKLTLSYDFTFVALLGKAIEQDCPKITKCKCMVHPFVKKTCTSLDDQEMLSSAAVMMLYMKFSDDIHDHKVFKKLYYKNLQMLTKPAFKKAKERYPELYKAFAQTIMKQNDVEKQPNLSIDVYSQPTSEGLAYLLSCISQDDSQKRVLSRLGFLLGKYVYQVDALDDLEKDLKNDTFNPYIFQLDRGIDIVKSDVVCSLNMLIGEIIATYELIEFVRYKEVLDNIVYFGLQNTVTMITKQCDNKENGVTI